MTVLPINPSASSLTRRSILILQSLTLGWMLIECAVSIFAALRAHSPALLAFGCDSLVELLSAALVVVALPGDTNQPTFGECGDRSARTRRIDFAAGILLFVLAAVVVLTSVLALAGEVHPETSPLGMAVTVAALLVMPLLAWQKRKLARRSGSNALAADSVQSATCAYLALIALAGLALNATFHIAWADSIAALGAVPILILEGRRAMRGQSCGCH